MIRKSKEAVLKNQSAEKIKALPGQRDLRYPTLSNVGDAVITTDINGGVTFLNPLAQTLTGWTQGDAAGNPKAKA